MTAPAYLVLRNEQAILAACRQYKKIAIREKELHRRLHDTLTSGSETKERWEKAKAERNAQAERILLLIETGKRR